MEMMFGPAAQLTARRLGLFAVVLNVAFFMGG
jgi:hypothetical protein